MRALRAIAAGAATLAALIAGGVLAVGIGSVAHPQAGGPPPAVGACTRDPLSVGLSVAYVAALHGYAVSTVTVTDTSATPRLGRCVGEPFRVTLRGPAGTVLGELSGAVPAGRTSFSPAAGLAHPIGAAAVSAVSLSLGG